MATDNTAAEKRDQLRRAWARDKLHAAGDRVDDARDAFWKVLVASQGTPPGEQRLAYRVLADSTVWSGDASSGIPPVVIAAADVAVEAQLSAAIEQFAAEFFSLAPAERRERFKTLQADAACFPRLDRRLNAFCNVLEAEPVKNAAYLARELELATWLEKLCVAPPAERGALRCRALQALYESFLHWPMVAQSLRKRDPAAVECDRALLEAIEQRQERTVTRERIRGGRAVTRTNQNEPKSLASTTTSSSKEGFPTWVVVMLIIMGLRGVTSAVNSLDRSTSRQTPQYKSVSNARNPYYKSPGQSWEKTSPLDFFPRRINPTTGRDEVDMSKVGPAIRAALGQPPPTEAELKEMSPELRKEYENGAQKNFEERFKSYRKMVAPP